MRQSATTMGWRGGLSLSLAMVTMVITRIVESESEVMAAVRVWRFSLELRRLKL